MSPHLSDPEVQRLPFLGRVRELQNRRLDAEEVISHDLINQPVSEMLGATSLYIVVE
jgi:hypothetical protein